LPNEWHIIERELDFSPPETIQMSLFTEHLESVEETYLQHLRHALSFSVAMFAGSIACGIHALLPFLFVTTGSDCIRRLHDKMVVNRKNLTPASKKRLAPAGKEMSY